jgi:hypothetical protein
VQGTVAKLTGLTPFEIEYQRQKHGVQRTLFTKAQWRSKNRWVMVSDEEAVKTIITKAGRRLLLFSEAQTQEIEA